MLDTRIAQGRKIYTVEQSLAGAEQYWRNGDVQLIDKAGSRAATAASSRPAMDHELARTYSGRDPCADILETSGGERIVKARFPAIAAQRLLLEGSRGPRPTMPRTTANAKRIVDVLVGASAETIWRNGEILYAKPGHNASVRCE